MDAKAVGWARPPTGLEKQGKSQTKVDWMLTRALLGQDTMYSKKKIGQQEGVSGIECRFLRKASFRGGRCSKIWRVSRGGGGHDKNKGSDDEKGAV